MPATCAAPQAHWRRSRRDWLGGGCAALEYESDAQQVLLQRARCALAMGDFAAAYGETRIADGAK